MYPLSESTQCWNLLLYSVYWSLHVVCHVLGGCGIPQKRPSFLACKTRSTRSPFVCSAHYILVRSALNSETMQNRAYLGFKSGSLANVPLPSRIAMNVSLLIYMATMLYRQYWVIHYVVSVCDKVRTPRIGAASVDKSDTNIKVDQHDDMAAQLFRRNLFRSRPRC